MTPQPSRRSILRIPLTLGALLLIASPGSFGCGHSRTEGRRLPAWVFESSRTEKASAVRGPPHRLRPRAGVSGRSQAADLVVSALQSSGLRFGTDGSVASLWGYLRTSYSTVATAEVRPGDVLFFETRAAPASPCDPPNHVAIVSAVDDDRRIAFLESRDGQVRQSYADFSRPWLRRDERGRVLNTFLRPKRIDDPADTPTFAGEMVCAAIRPEP